ncbi:hypothetical protein NL108_017458 [Boleophthalmus pectinirostris]|nr:hypothetical protein NL108_017458 [Boleophthalmus pectinirostris]
MASRKKGVRLPKRTGLRSQSRVRQPEGAAAPDPVWKSEEEEEWEDKPEPSSEPGQEMVALMREFLAGQQRREEGLLAELRGLRASLPAAENVAQCAPPPQPAPRVRPVPHLPAPILPAHLEAGTPTSTASSPRMGLPNPGCQTSLYGSRMEGGGGAELQHQALELDDRPRPEWRHFSEPKIPQYQSGEDMENYLLRFERIAKTWRWPEEEWACRLVPLLSGKALEAYSAMDEERAHCYGDLKEALLAKFDISPETYRQQFRSSTLSPGESPTETYHRLRGLYRRWIRPEERTKEEIGEAIIMEQLLRVFPFDVRTWVKEHEPADGFTAAKLAVQYLNARKGGPATRSTTASQRAPVQPLLPRPARRDYSQDQPGTTSTAQNQRGPGKELICFYCQQPGHKASVCPVRKAKVSGACYPPRPESESSRETENTVQRYKNVLINGHNVTALLDTGSFTSLIKRSSVPVSSLDYSKTVDILCVHFVCVHFVWTATPIHSGCDCDCFRSALPGDCGSCRKLTCRCYPWVGFTCANGLVE